MSADLDELAAEAASCTRCDLYRDATQTVFGKGAPKAKLMLVGEQPGDVEDRRGLPFVDLREQCCGAASRKRGSNAATSMPPTP